MTVEAEVDALTAVERARGEIKAALSMRQISPRRVRYHRRYGDQLIRAFNDLAAVKFDIRADQIYLSLKVQRRVRSRLQLAVANVPEEIAEHLVAAIGHLDRVGDG